MAVFAPLSEAAQRGLGHLAHIDAAFRVYPEAVRRDETAGRAWVRATPACQDVAVNVADADPGRAGFGHQPAPHVGRALPPVHLPENDGPVRGNEQIAGASDVGPDREKLAGRAEDLDAVVLAVADEDAAVGMGPDRVRQVELAVSGARLTPGLE